MTYIYESPDKGKTVYRRPFGKDKPRELVNKDIDSKNTCTRYPDHCNPDNCEFWHDDFCDDRRKLMETCSEPLASCSSDTCPFYYYESCIHSKGK